MSATNFILREDGRLHAYLQRWGDPDYWIELIRKRQLDLQSFDQQSSKSPGFISRAS
jgi:hypothetical protein